MQNATHILGAFAARRLPDEGLFDRAIRGDAVAFSEVYRRYEKRVYGFCLARSLDREAAADATQEVFIRLLKAAPSSVEHPRAWLFTVARNVITDAIRKRVRLREAGEVDEDALAWESLATMDAAEEVFARADAQAVFLALRRMKPRYRTALILRELHGQSSADIAEAMGVRSTGAVDTLVSRARDAFGVAYAALSELPKACRGSVALMYRSRGTGISTRENDVLRAHLVSCERCRREDARAGDPKRLSALLPLLVPAGDAARSLFGRALVAGGSLPDVPVTRHIAEFLQTHLHTVGARVAVGVVTAALVAAPVVATRVTSHDVARPAAGSADAHASLSSAEPVKEGDSRERIGTDGLSPGVAREMFGMRAAGAGLARVSGFSSGRPDADVGSMRGRVSTGTAAGALPGGAGTHGTAGKKGTDVREASTKTPGTAMNDQAGAVVVQPGHASWAVSAPVARGTVRSRSTSRPTY